MLLTHRLPPLPSQLVITRLRNVCQSSHRFASAQTNARSKPPNPYAHTVLLPQTDLPSRHGDQAAVDRRLKDRTTTELYVKQFESNAGDLFILHDGPPYANGDLHMGHALNRILKDIITRFKVLRGYRVHYVPGWDCHGLPIEQKALSEIRKSHTTLDPLDIRKVARNSAKEAIAIQTEQLKDFGIMADWESQSGTYRTMDHEFEIRELRIFQDMVKKGLISYHLRPTFYSPALRSALAESELSYEDDHESRSVYIGYPVAAEDMSKNLRQAWEQAGSPSLKLPIWTTTPWSLPGNLGIAVSPDTKYCLVHTDRFGALVLAEECLTVDRKGEFEKLFGGINLLSRVTGKDMVGTGYTHPFHGTSAATAKPVVFPSKFVTAATGTGLVHSAPAHGFEDYEAFQDAGLPVHEMRSPIDKAGNYTAEVAQWSNHPIAKELVGLAVQGAGVEKMIELFKAESLLLGEETIRHRYPYAWKAKKPIITLGMRQWFADIGPIKSDAMEAISKIRYHPAHAQNRLRAHVDLRSEWCISRQRSWGVPIPALYDESGTPLTDEASIAHVVDVLEDKGADAWWSEPVETFTPPHHRHKQLRKGTDTLDVWFDSGTSWSLIKAAGLRSEDSPLADVYLEGSDQHRGWFQSSLLTYLLTTKGGKPRAPYSTLIQHGFINDEKGQKMSKSLGNGLSPVEVIRGKRGQPGHGADALRLWAAKVDYPRDVSIGPSAVTQAAEMLRKIRGAMRFMLANLRQGDIPSIDDVKLGLMDWHVLDRLGETEHTVLGAYEQYTFSNAVDAIYIFINSTMSTPYFDIVRDTLYCEAKTSEERRAIVATLSFVLHRLLHMIAPMLPHLAEEFYEASRGAQSSIFLETWQDMVPPPSHDRTLVKNVLQLRQASEKLQMSNSEGQSKTGNRNSSLIVIEGPNVSAQLQPHQFYLASILGVSEVALQSHGLEGQALASTTGDLPELGQVTITVWPARHAQCPRCRLHTAQKAGHLCGRCEIVVGQNT